MHAMLYTVPAAQGRTKLFEIMRDMTTEALQYPAFRKLVSQFARFTSQQELFQSLHRFVVNSFQYVDDLYDETITAPARMLELRRGDCDDFSLFIYTVLKYLNYQPRYLLLGARPGETTHIVVECNGYILDGTNNHFNTIPEKYKYREYVR